MLLFDEYEVSLIKVSLAANLHRLDRNSPLRESFNDILEKIKQKENDNTKG
jgi:hypothetical protein